MAGAATAAAMAGAATAAAMVEATVAEAMEAARAEVATAAAMAAVAMVEATAARWWRHRWILRRTARRCRSLHLRSPHLPSPCHPSRCSNHQSRCRFLPSPRHSCDLRESWRAVACRAKRAAAPSRCRRQLRQPLQIGPGKFWARVVCAPAAASLRQKLPKKEANLVDHCRLTR